MKEPDYDPERIRQSPEITRWIEEAGKTVLSNWRQRKNIQAQLQEAKDFDVRSRNIYYDTDNIAETQEETIRICRDCGGALKIDSSSNRGERILAIHIPRKACKACGDLGRKWYDAADPNDFDQILLQDRPADMYHERK